MKDARIGDETASNDENERGTSGTSRRRWLSALAATATGGLLGARTLVDRGRAARRGRTGPSPSAVATETWVSDHFADRPLYSLSLPGVHHAATYDLGDPDDDGDWWDCQSRRVREQLDDGIRYLDLRVEAQDGDDGIEFYGHHGGAGSNDDLIGRTGASLTNEVFPEVRAYLDDVAAAGANEVVLVEFDKFWDSAGDTDAFEPRHWQAFSDQLEAFFGEYAFDLGSRPASDLAATRPADLDGPTVAVSYDGEYRPWFVGSDFGGPTWLDQPRPGKLYTEAIEQRHEGTDVLHGVQWLVTPPAEAYVTSWADSQYDSVYEAAVRANDLLPGFVDRVEADPGLNPNVIEVDFYETSRVVDACIELSAFGLHGSGGEYAPVDEGTYTLQSMASGEVVEVEDGWWEDPYEDGADVEEEPYKGDADQRFVLDRLADGTYRLVAEHSGKVLDVEGAGTDNGTDVHQWTWHGGANQRWHPIPLADGTFAFVNANSGRVLDGADPGDNVHQWHWHGGTNQRWHLERRD